MKKTALLIILVTILSKVIGFGREIVLSYTYGASYISDAYIISMTIPNSIFALIAAGLTAAYIPSFNRICKIENREKANIFTSNLINLLFIVSTLIVILVLIFTNEVVALFASGFSGKDLDLAIKFTRISIISIYFSGFVSVFSGYLQNNNQFLIPAAVGLPLNFALVISIILSKMDLLVLPIGFVIAMGLQFILLVPTIKQSAYRHVVRIDFKDKYLTNMLLSSIPVIIGISVNQINVLVDRTIASRIVEGGISALNYSAKLNSFIQGIFVMSLISIAYPKLSKIATNSDFRSLKISINELIITVSVMVIPATIGFMVFSEEIIKVLFDRGAFDDLALLNTSSTLFFYSIGMLGYGLREVLSRVFYTLEDTKTPMINAGIGMLINIILNIILSKYFGLSGLALATSISAILITILLIMSLKKKIGSLGLRNMIIVQFKILLISVIMGVFAKIAYIFLINYLGVYVALFGSILIGIFAYTIMILLARISEVDFFVEEIIAKLRR